MTKSDVSTAVVATAERVALDTSCAVPLLMATHPSHAAVRSAISTRSPVLTAHSLAETYSVLTRLSGDARVEPKDAARLIASEFGEPALVDNAVTRTLTTTLSTVGIAGGAVYDALVGLAALSENLTLMTRDARALGTYAAVGARVEVVGA